jgi:glycosyltransferase involved in cell wall biosynthesis
LQDTATRRDDEVRALHAIVSGREEEIRALQGAVTQRDEQIRTLQETVTWRDDEARALHETISGREEEIRELQQSRSQNNEAARELQIALTQRDDAIRVSEERALAFRQLADKAMAEEQRLRVAYEAIVHSSMWRLTGPLRQVAGWMPQHIRRSLRMALRLVYWSVTFQLWARLRERPGSARSATSFDIDQYLRSFALRLLAPLHRFARRRLNFVYRIPGVRIRVKRIREQLPPAPTPERDWSSAFDASFYLQENPDVAAAGIDPLTHYLNYGQAEGRYPNAYAARGMADIRLTDFCEPGHDEPTPRTFDDTFCVSVVTPAYNTEPQYLRELLQTLRNQHYANWEWVVVDDGSSKPETVDTLRELADAEPRVRLTISAENRGISAASNTALAAARGTHVALVDHDDLISRNAFLAIYEAWKKAPKTDLFYTDECKLQYDGQIGQFWAKPDWSPAYLECTMALGHLAVYEIGFLRAIGGFRSEYDGTQDYDLALRASLAKPSVQHVPIFAYLWRMIPGSAALNLSEKHYAIERQAKAVLDYARHKHPDAKVVPGWAHGYWRIMYPLPTQAALLSYIIPTAGGSRIVRDQRIDLVLNCIRSFKAQAFYPNCEYIVLHNGNLSDEQICNLQAIPNVRIVKYDAPAFNLSEKINLGVSKARGEFVCLLNDDVEAITPRGGEELVSYLAMNPEVGCIGPLCLYEEGTIQQNGVVLLEKAGPAHAGATRGADFGGHQSNLRCRRESFGITGAVMMVKKSNYDLVGGFSEDLPLNYNDVDFCLKLREKGLSCVIDPTIRVYHYEGATKSGTNAVEQERFFLNHPGATDPYFSQWFDQGNPNYVLNFTDANKRRGFGPWLDRHIARRAAALVPKERYKLSVCVSVYNQSKSLLEEMYRSVLMQTYKNTEFVILDNGSSNLQTLSWLDGVRREARAKVIRADTNLGISGGNLKLLENLTGDYFVAMDADDFLSVDALQMMAYVIEQHPSKKVFYSDEYKSDVNSSRFQPFFKPDFDPVLLMNCCYPAHLMAMEADYLRKIGSYTDHRATWCHDYDTLTRALADGEEPIHVREAVYAWRINPGSTASATTFGKPETVESQIFVLTRLLQARGLEGVLAIEPNTLEGSAGMWHLTASQPVANVKILEASEVWSKSGIGVGGLKLLADQEGVEWIAILLDPRAKDALLELSAPALFDPRVNTVCGLLVTPDGVMQWTGGLFLPNCSVFDPYVGRQFCEGGYHGQLWCQRCIDVPAPVNVLVRASALVRAVNRPGVNDPDTLMAMLGCDAQERSEFVVATPRLRAPLPSKLLIVPSLDGLSRLTDVPALKHGSRWYDERLETERPYMMSGFWS